MCNLWAVLLFGYLLCPQNIQSTNWQSMRFKPPPPNSTIGWRVEFRPLEVQLTEFENAAFVVFVVLLTRAILSFKLNFYIPISKVGDVMLTIFVLSLYGVDDVIDGGKHEEGSVA